MAKRRRRRQTKARNEDYPGWVWLLFGLSIGLAVAFAVFVNGRTPPLPTPDNTQAATNPPVEPARTPAPAASDEPDPESRFAFYDMLPNFEVVIVEQEPDVKRDVALQAVVDPGEYVLQAGSFSQFDDAERRRAELALQGIQSSIQRVSINTKVYHRVRVGPTRDLDKLNMLRSRLREANIDVLRIRLGD